MKLEKRIVSVLLIIAIIFVPALSVGASAHEIRRSCPNIEVHGFMASKIYEDKNDPDSTVIWPPNVDSILTTVKSNIFEFAKLTTQKNWDELGESVSRMISDTLFPVYIGDDGEVHDNSGVYFVYPEPEAITKDCEVQFTYDWRTNPIDIAAQLNDYINYVLECSGSDKVTLECHSLGGGIVTAYLTLYGNEKIQGVAFNSTAVFGSTAIGQLMSGNVEFDADALQEYLYFIFDYNDYNHLINGLINLAKSTGLLGVFANQFNRIFELIGFILAKDAIIPMFGNWLTIWSLVPNEYYDDAYRNVFDVVYKGEDHSELIGKIEKYNELIRYNKVETLQKLNENANLYVICRYGYSSAPVSDTFGSISDGIIDAKYASFGATTSLYGQALQEEYLQNIPPKYISPNKSIDASTCLFPEQTWFVNDMRHFKTPEPLGEFIDYLLAYDGQADVGTFNEYPRFLTYDSATDTIAKDTDTTKVSIWTKIWIVIDEIFRLLKHWFGK